MQKLSHKVVHDLVASIEPLDQIEEEHIHFVRRWIESGSEIFRLVKPSTPDTHLVAYFILFDQESGQILLTAHKKSSLWLPPGGHVELDEHPTCTVIREAKEELDIEAEFIKKTPFFLTVTKTVGIEQHTDVSLWYLLKGRRADKYNYDTREFTQIRWFQSEEIPYHLSDSHMRRFIDKLNKFLTLNSYESTVCEYSRNTETLHPHLHAKNFIEMLSPHAKIIDIGCGPGRDAKIFQENGLRVVGIDFSPKMIAIAKQNAPKAEFHVMNMERMDFPKEAFEGAWASASFVHLPKKRVVQVFKNIHNFLKTNGVFYLSVKKGTGEALAQDKRYGNMQKFWSFFEEAELVDLLKEANFEIVEANCMNPKSSYQTHPTIHVFCKKRGEK